MGDFIQWDKTAAPMKKKKDGTLYTAVTLETSKDYQFGYSLGDGRWGKILGSG